MPTCHLAFDALKFALDYNDRITFLELLHHLIRNKAYVLGLCLTKNLKAFNLSVGDYERLFDDLKSFMVRLIVETEEWKIYIVKGIGVHLVFCSIHKKDVWNAAYINNGFLAFDYSFLFD